MQKRRFTLLLHAGYGKRYVQESEMGRVEDLIGKLESSDLEKVKENLRHGRYLSWKISYVEEWIAKKEAPTVMYHEVHAPTGETFKAFECAQLERKGWVDTSAKFGKGFRSKVRKVKNVVVSFLRKEWKWVLVFLATLVGLWIANLKL